MTRRLDFFLILVGFAGALGCRAQAPAPHDDDHGDEAHEDVVELSPEAVASARIGYGKVRVEVFVEHVEVPARLALTLHGVAKVTSRVPGRVAKVLVRQGDEVREGATLAVIESQALGQTRAEYIAAAVKVAVARENFELEKELVAKGISAEREMRAAQGALAAAQAKLDAADAQLHALGLSENEIRALKADDHYSASFPARAPLAGTVIAVDAVLGQSVEGTAELFTVAQLSTLWALLDVSETQLSLVHVGERVELTTPALPGARIEGVVDWVGAVVKPSTRTVEVRVVVPNPEHKLKPGMFATARLATTPSANAVESLTVPASAVQQVGHESVVFVPEPEQAAPDAPETGKKRFNAVTVVVGRHTPELAEIISGLEPDTTVVVAGAFVLKSELLKSTMSEGHSH